MRQAPSNTSRSVSPGNCSSTLGEGRHGDPWPVNGHAKHAHATEMIAHQEPPTVGREKRAVDVAVENRAVVLAGEDRDVVQRPLDPCGGRRITDLTNLEVASDVVDEQKVVERGPGD